MGQYRGRSKNAVESIKIEAEAKVLSGYPTIIIKKSVLQDIKEKLHTDIIKIKIHNHIETTYYWSLQNIDRAAVITFKGLKPGKYTLEIEPYSKYRFIKEFNNLVREKHSIQLWIEKEKLILRKSEKLLTTDKRTFEKEHGGAIHIIAEYPSITRQEGKIKIKYQIKNEDAEIYIQEPRTGRKRDVSYKVLEVNPVNIGLLFNYKHGEKVKSSLAFYKEDLSCSLEKIYVASEDDVFRFIPSLSRRKFGLNEYQFQFTNKELQEKFDVNMLISYHFMMKSGEELAEMGKDMRDQIGKSIVTAYLKKLGYKDIIVDPINWEVFKKNFS